MILEYWDISLSLGTSVVNYSPSQKTMRSFIRILKELSDTFYSTFIEILIYKTNYVRENHRKCIDVLAYNQLYHVCGHQNSEVKNLAVRKRTCPDCHTMHDRDDNRIYLPSEWVPPTLLGDTYLIGDIDLEVSTST